MTDVKDFIREKGYDFEPRLENKMFSFKSNGVKGWYIGSQEGDRTTFSFGTWATGEKYFYATGYNGQGDEKIQELKVKVKEDKRAINEQTKALAQKIWAGLKQSDHYYLAKKNLSEAFGSRINNWKNQNLLVIPLHDNQGVLWNLQIIGSNKKFLTGGRVLGLYHTIGSYKDKIYIAEGFATAATVHMATQHMSICAFNCNNLKPVYEAVREAFPSAEIIIAADDDWAKPQNAGTGAAKALEQEFGTKYIIPDFGSKLRGEKDTDWNDLYIREGLDEVKRQLSPVIEKENTEKKTKAKKKTKDEAAQRWDEFFKTSFTDVVKDVFSLETFIKNEKDADWIPIKSQENTLKSYARAKKLNKTHVIEELSRWCYENEETDYLCKLPKWDNIDRIKAFAACIKSAKMSEHMIEDILKNWGVNVFRRLHDPEIQNRCIILKGGQGLGKDTLIRAMFGGFKPYYQQTTLTGTPKDALEIASRLLILHLEEFNQTKSMDMGFLKSLITQPSSFFRESYGYSPNAKPMRVSFFSSENLDDIFRDTTGNRRFVVIPIHEIKWNYPRGESLQVMAQLKHLYDQGLCFEVEKKTDEVIKRIVDSLTPEPLENDIIALYVAKFRAVTAPSFAGVLTPYPGRRSLRSEEIIPIISEIAKKCNCSMRRVQSAVKQFGLSYRSRDGYLYFASVESAMNREAHVESESPA